MASIEKVDNKYDFLKVGILIYFNKDVQFLFFRKEHNKDIKAKILAIKKQGSRIPTQLSPIDVHVAVLRKGITKDNIDQFFQGNFLELNMDSNDFLKEMSGPVLGTRHTKTKGKMEGYDVLVKTWYIYSGTAKNLGIFTL